MNAQSHTSPYKFLDSYSAEDKSIFFGRDREVEEVYDKVFQSKLLLVYGASGTGKSSIINCGLANKFEEEDWFPIHIRRGGNIRRSLFNQVQKEAIHQVNISEDEASTNKGLEKVINSVYLDHFKPIYLIFDQFEELFIFGFKDEWEDFISGIRYLMDTDLDVHFIFIIRGEYLEFLSEFEEHIPEFFDNRMRIEKMTRKRAEAIVSGPAQLHSIEVDQGFEENLLKKLSPDKSQIELTFLQVFLDKIYKSAASRSGGDAIKFTNESLDELGQLGNILAEFVDEQLFQMEDPKAALTVLKSFVSLQGTKVQKTVEESKNYCHDLGLELTMDEVENIVHSFVSKRILKDHDDNGRYELRHDSLAQKIYEKITNQEKELLDVKQFLHYSLNEFQKRGILLNDDDLAYVAIYERNLEIDEKLKEFLSHSKKHSTKRRKYQRRRSIIFTIILGLLLTSIAGFIYSQVQKDKAEQLTLLAEREKAEAENQRSLAEQNEKRANEQSAIALSQRRAADEARQEAEQAQIEAESQRSDALQQRSIAREQQALAEAAKEDAVTSQEEALSQKAYAEDQRRIAERLRMLSLSRELAIKSSFLTDKELKGLLSLYAYRFNVENLGNSFNPDLYQALHSARKEYWPDENIISQHRGQITDIHSTENGIYSISDNGQLILSNSSGSKTLLNTTYAFEVLSIWDEKTMLIGTQNGSILFYNLDDGSIERQLQPHTRDITAIIKMNTKMISASLDGTLHILEMEDQSVKTLELDNEIKGGIEKDGSIWVISGTNNLQKIGPNGAAKLHEVAGHSLTTIENDPLNDQLFLGTRQGDILVWEIQSSEILQILSSHSSAITDLNLSEDHRFLGASSLDRTVRIWSMEGSILQPIVLNDHDNWASAIAFGGSNILTGTYSGSLKSFDLSIDNLTNGLCDKINRDLTTQEWNEYIGESIPKQKICNE